MSLNGFLTVVLLSGTLVLVAATARATLKEVFGVELHGRLAVNTLGGMVDRLFPDVRDVVKTADEKKAAGG